MGNLIKVASFDLDGTLLNSVGEISTANIRAIRQLTQQGVAIVLASGRPIESLVHFSDQVLQVETDKIGFNGAVIADGASGVLHSTTIAVADVIAVIKLANRFNINVNFSTASKWLNFSPQTSQSSVDKYNETLTEIRISSLDQLKQVMADQPVAVLKIGMYIEEPKKLRVMQHAMESLSLNVVQSDNGFLEATSRGVSKYTGFKYLAKNRNWRPETTLAFGDYENDYELIKAVKYGIAMENGLDKLKTVAWRVTATNDADGIARIINDYFLENEV